MAIALSPSAPLVRAKCLSFLFFAKSHASLDVLMFPQTEGVFELDEWLQVRFVSFRLF